MITYFKYQGGKTESWEFDPVNLSKINLLVGGSGSGKTRFLNTFFNFADSVSKGTPFRTGKWNLEILIGKDKYKWDYEGQKDEENQAQIISENLTVMSGNGPSTELVLRDQNTFNFLGNKLPKLERDKLSVTLLKEEDQIKPIYNVFSHVLRRRFHEDELNKAVAYEAIPEEIISKLEVKLDPDLLWGGDHPLHSRMYLLNKYFNNKYKVAIDFFKQVFPSILDVELEILKNVPMAEQSVMPVFLVKEKGVKNLIPVNELSSGMQKVLLIITDILTLSEGSIYLIDEYENSLGINAIDFLPEFLINESGENQFLITTHHPYLINKMPIKNWIVFSRTGSKVFIKSGSEFENKFGKSKQKAFVQLINDPFYLKGE